MWSLLPLVFMSSSILTNAFPERHGSIFVLLNYIILILIRNNDTILDAVNNDNYYGNQVIAFWVACLSDTFFSFY